MFTTTTYHCDFEVHLSDSQKSEEGGYTNRYQWGNNWDYGPSITWMKTNIQSTYRWDMASEQMKYAEVQAVSGGVTAMQGSLSSAPKRGIAFFREMLSYTTLDKTVFRRVLYAVLQTMIILQPFD